MSIVRAWKLLAAYWLEDAAAEKPATGLGDGYVPTLQADDTVKWSRMTGEILVDDASGEILFDDATGDVLYEG